MPYKLTRREVIARIAMRALLDAVPGLTQRRLAGLFHASTRTVNDAAKRPVCDWYAELESAKDAPTPSPSRSVPIPGPRARAMRPWWDPEVTEARSGLRGSRSRARLVAPDDAGDGIALEPADDGLEEERERQARAAERCA